jgi:hypothetical protein
LGSQSNFSANRVLPIPDTAAAAVRKTIFGHAPMTLIRVTPPSKALT